MGLCIDGMEMPKEGRITIQIGADGAVYTVSSCKITAEKYEEKYQVIEFPEPHGRLIDADAMLMRINHEVMEAYMDGACYGVHPSQEHLYLLGEIIDDAPTVIPASEEGET